MDFIVVISATRTHLSGLLTEFFNAVAVKLDFVEPFFAIGDVLNGEGMHWLNKLYGAGLGWLHRRQSEGTNKKLLTNHFWRDSNLPAASLCL